MKGIRLSESQGKYIIEGKKKMIILTEEPPKDFYNADIAIVEDEQILGTLQLKGGTGPLNPGSIRSNLRALHSLSDEDWDKRAEKDPKFNQSIYTITFDDVKPWDKPTLYDKSGIEGEYWLSNIEIKAEESHSRFKCMNCDEPPTVEILWAEGKAHAWFCTSCYKEWEQEDDMHEINYEREIYGVASKTWKEGPLSEEKSKEERKTLEGASTSDDVLREEPEEIIEGPQLEGEPPEGEPPTDLIQPIEEILKQEAVLEKTLNPWEVVIKKLSSGFITIDDDEVWNAINTWEKNYNFSEEGLKHLQNAHSFLQGQTDKFVIFALTAARKGVELPHIPLNENWYMDEAGRLIVKSYSEFIEEIELYKEPVPEVLEPPEPIAPIPEEKPVLEDEVSKIVEQIMSHLKGELTGMVKSEIVKLAEQTSEEKASSAQDEYIKKKTELVEHMKKLLERGEKTV